MSRVTRRVLEERLQVLCSVLNVPMQEHDIAGSLILEGAYENLWHIQQKLPSGGVRLITDFMSPRELLLAINMMLQGINLLQRPVDK